ncbi:hypothetical protein E3O45_13965 [Cryobacterium sp. TMS1-20-1]|uniref:hypothetical protein n=1 Tax=Cryobacterium sp. TMS1-20-1 TaxID=1259223 RepID=UPI00106B6283|nr:hypothetical protein [Cryobacterium sp. TMS1-20-1]TFC72098.1 hypothetical protein E3O45_13965 [Cryobacterium sp. TMS1-20-1]
MIRVLWDGGASLTATENHSSNEPELMRQISDTLAPTVGRLVFNGFPTGVRASWAQHHDTIPRHIDGARVLPR